jgi:uncharacterized protein (DUF924 family)
MRRGSGPDAANIERVLRFWVDEIGPAGWYEVDEAVDRRCAAEFGRLMEDALAGRLSAWQATPPGALALLILLDQLPRNAFRGSAGAHSGDARARAVAKAAIARGYDLRMPEPERQFFYLPLMHSESLADQHRCVRLVLTRLPESGADNRHHGILHRDVIRRFGRFPSRNRALGRADSEAERDYRAAGGYMG